MARSMSARLPMPSYQNELNDNSSAKLPRAKNAGELATQLMQLIATPNQADKSWITAQYDKYVGGKHSAFDAG